MRTGDFKENPGQLVALSDSRMVWTWLFGTLCLLLLAPFLIGNYGLTLMVSSLIAIIGAVALNILTGQTGLISLGQAPEAYQAFDSGIPKKFVIDPHHSVRN